MTDASTLITVVGVLVVAIVAAWVSLPLFGAPSTIDPKAATSDVDNWQRQKRQALAAIKESELDFQMGKLSQEDYDRMRARFEARALEAIRALDAAGGPSPAAE